MGELTLTDSLNGTYYLRPENIEGRNAFMSEIGIFDHTPIDGYYVVELSREEYGEKVHRNLGLVPVDQDPSEKMYECAVQAGKKYAEELGVNLVDRTRMATEILNFERPMSRSSQARDSTIADDTSRYGPAEAFADHLG